MKNQIENLGSKRLNEIIAYLKQAHDDTTVLPDEYRAHLDMLDFADNQIRQTRKVADAARIVAKRFECSLSTAYKLCHETQLVYGSITWYQKEYWRRILFEQQMTMIERAKDKNDHKAFNVAMKNLISLLQLDKDDSGKVRADQLEQHNFQFVINLPGEKQSYDVDFNKLNKLPQEDRLKIVKATQAENIEFDIISMIDKEENE